MPKILVFVGIAFALMFAILVGNRLADQTHMALASVICGISASIPATLGFLIVSNRNWSGEKERT